MYRIPLALAARKPDAVHRLPLGAAAGVGVLLGVGFVLLTLSGVPILGWMLLAGVATTALVDIVLIAAGRRPPSILERLLARPPGSE